MIDSTQKKASKNKIVEIKNALKPSEDTLFLIRMFARAYSQTSVQIA